MTTPEDRLTKETLGLDFFVIETTPARSPQTLAVLPEHLAHQKELERRGILFCAGPVTEEGDDVPSSGMIIIRARDFDEARAIADSDPFHARGIRSYRIRRWRVNEGSMKIELSLSDRAMRFT